MLSNRSTTTNPNETANPVSTQPVVNSSTADVNAPPSAEGMVEISSDTYEVGIPNPSDEYHSEALSISLPGFWIDKYQVTNSDYKKYIDATGSQPPVISGNENQPVRGVTWDQAAAYCSWANKRLPTEAEWEAAGRGPGTNPQLYPWGSDDTGGGLVNTMPNDDTYEKGAFSFNVSPFGVFDLVGNVWEWVGEPYSSLDGGNKILRGGRYGNPQDLAYRLAVSANDERYVKFAGFRCAANDVK